MTEQRKQLIKRLQRLWERHDKLEREIIKLERKFTDKDLDRLL